MESNDDELPIYGGLNTTPAESDQAHTASSSAATASANNILAKRRRGLGVVTPNACNECRKKRVKVCQKNVTPPELGISLLTRFLSPLV